MAATFTGYAAAVTFAANKSMLGIYNGSGSGQVIRVYRIWMLNNQTGAISGDLVNMELWTVSALSGGSAVTVSPHDSTNTALNGNVVVQYAASAFTDVARLKRFYWWDDEAAIASSTRLEWETMVRLGLVWSCGYDDESIEPIVLREGQGVHLKNGGQFALGNADLMIEFTMT